MFGSKSDEGLNTLLHLRYNPEHKAERGHHGEGSNRSGKDGESITVKVPVGTQVFDRRDERASFRFYGTGSAVSCRKRRQRRLGKRSFRDADATSPEISLHRSAG